MHKDTIQYGQGYDTSRLKSVKADNIPPLLRMCIIVMNYIQTKALFSSIIQTNFAILGHKTTAIQTKFRLFIWLAISILCKFQILNIPLR